MTLDADRLIADLLARANEQDKRINRSFAFAREELERLRAAARDAIKHSELTQPYLVNAERWEARTIKETDGAFYLEIKGGGWSMSGEPCARLRTALDACDTAYRTLSNVHRDTRDIVTERDLLRRLAADVRLGRLGQPEQSAVVELARR